jgi:hypothetical protein
VDDLDRLSSFHLYSELIDRRAIERRWCAVFIHVDLAGAPRAAIFKDLKSPNGVALVGSALKIKPSFSKICDGSEYVHSYSFREAAEADILTDTDGIFLPEETTWDQGEGCVGVEEWKRNSTVVLPLAVTE